MDKWNIFFILGLVVIIISAVQFTLDIIYYTQINYYYCPQLLFDIDMVIVAGVLLLGGGKKQKKAIIKVGHYMFLSAMIISLIIVTGEVIYDKDLPRYVNAVFGIFPACGIVTALIMISGRKQAALRGVILVVMCFLWTLWGTITGSLGCFSVVGVGILMGMLITFNGTDE